MKIDATEIVRFFTFVLLVVFLWLGLQAYSYLENYNSAVRYVDSAYKIAYANLTCCVCMGTINDIDQFKSPFSIKPNVTINTSD